MLVMQMMCAYCTSASLLLKRAKSTLHPLYLNFKIINRNFSIFNIEFLGVIGNDDYGNTVLLPHLPRAVVFVSQHKAAHYDGT